MAIPLDLAGRVALVTGGTRGIGRGISERLSAAGATVAVCARTAPTGGTASGAPTGGAASGDPTGGVASDALIGDASFFAADVRDAEQVEALVAAVTERFGSLDIVVNNAGGAPASPAATASPRFSEAIVRLNLLAALHVATRANAQMQTQSTGGVIVNVASTSGLRPSPGTAAYGAAKAGLLSLTESLALEWAPKVRVVAVSAGMVRTEAFEELYGGHEAAAAAEATVPLGRAIAPSDVGDAVVFLASPLASMISGANLVVHGGGEPLALSERLQ